MVRASFVSALGFRYLWLSPKIARLSLSLAVAEDWLRLGITKASFASALGFRYLCIEWKYAAC